MKPPNNPPSTKIICLQASSPKEKIHKILSTVHEHYESKKPLLLKTDNKETTDYLDKLLWEYPKDSFLPHSLSFSPESIITISSSLTVNPTVYSIFNFTKEALIHFPFLSKIYEIEDLTSLERKQIFEKKYKDYSNLSYHLISL
jgi:DNA polymerase IIIc chi subunit